MTSEDRADLDFLLESGAVARTLGLSHSTHLDQAIGIRNYIRIANDIARQLPSGRLLDWGCGYGQMTYLLRRRGLEVTAFDIGAPGESALPDIPLCRGLEIIRTSHPTKLPFEDGAFDALLSCGVLEHVDESGEPGDELKSLREIARVLRPGGRLLVYQLPQQHAWQEALARRLRRAYFHPRRYTAAEIAELLREAGFTVSRLKRANMLPKNLTGLPGVVRRAYSRFSRVLLVIDGALCRLPGLRAVAGSLEITAER